MEDLNIYTIDQRLILNASVAPIEGQELLLSKNTQSNRLKTMSMTTFFQFTETSYLPLPTPRHSQTPSASPPTSTTTTHPTPLPNPPSESSAEILQRGLKTALSMLHSPELMIALNPLSQHYARISPTDPAESHRLVDLPRLVPEFNVKVPFPPSCPSWNDSTNGEFVHYEIVDKFNMLSGMVSKLMTYKACFRPLYPDSSTPNTISGTSTRPGSIGLETISDPGSGVSLLGKWMLSLDDTRPGFIKLTESVNVHCGIVFGWFVRSQLETAHAALHKEFGRRFVMKMIEGDPLKGRDHRGGKSWGEVRLGLERVGSGSSVGSGVGLTGRDQMGEGQRRDKETDIEAMERETQSRNQRQMRTGGERENDTEDLVSSMGDENDGISSVGVSRAESNSAGTGLRRTRTNESDVSDMR